jgi:nitrate/nitrite-specific signal transduction histidine kinase
MTTVLTGDATAVNISGSLRMQSYRIAVAIQRNDATNVIELLEEFERRLTSPELAGHIPLDQTELSSLFKVIQNHFANMKSYALHEPTRYLTEVSDFVEDIDTLVERLEHWSESKIKRLKQQQIVISLLTLLTASLFALIISYRVVTPLKSLMGTVIDIGRGTRSARATYLRSDEFGELSHTLNDMASEIEEVHFSLESKIQEQTKELSRNNQILEFLFNLSQSLGVDRPKIESIKQDTSEKLMRLFPEFNIYWATQDTFTTDTQYVAKCSSDRSHLVCQHEQALDEWQSRVLITVVDLFDNAINRMGTFKNENRIALLNERSSIARELHDSLAQQLSYLKIQVVRWIKLKERGADDETLDAIVNELREGLNSSYRKLRELLVTFRGHSEEPGLIPSVNAAADEINRISQNTKIHLYIDDKWPEDLSPSQEIHCLHVIREALTNVIKHAQAENAVVSMQVLDNELQIKINDDGIGFGDAPEKPMHYGLEIMNERAERINGRVTYQTLNYGGAGVTLTFQPQLTGEE